MGFPAEAAEDGEEPQDHVGQGQGIGNILPGKFIYLEVALVMAQGYTAALTLSSSFATGDAARVQTGVPCAQHEAFAWGIIPRFTYVIALLMTTPIEAKNEGNEVMFRHLL